MSRHGRRRLAARGNEGWVQKEEARDGRGHKCRHQSGSDGGGICWAWTSRGGSGASGNELVGASSGRYIILMYVIA